MEPKPTRELFEQLVGEIVDQPERRAALEQKIRHIFSRRAAILVLDMCGFSRTTRAHGIIAFLVMIHEMQEFCTPIAKLHEGTLVKVEADNLIFLFDRVCDAVAAARAMNSGAPKRT